MPHPASAPADLDDVEAWSVYGDWLQSLDPLDPLGRLIAVEVAMRDDHRAALRDEHSALLEEHRHRSLGELAGGLGERGVYRWGFLTGVTIFGSEQELLRELAERPAGRFLTSISVRGGTMHLASLLRPLRARAIHLDISDNQLQPSALDYLLSDGPTIAHLNLCGNAMGSGVLSRLATCRFASSLRSLDLSYNQLYDEGLELKEGALDLRSLSLRGNEISADGVKNLLKGLRLPKQLDLGGNQLGDAGVQALASRCAFEQLALGRNNIGTPGLRALSGSRLKGGCQALYLDSNQISDEGAVALVRVAWPKLKRLDLSRNSIGGKGASAIAKRFSNSAADHLDLTLNRVPPQSVKALQESGFSSVELGGNGASPLIDEAWLDAQLLSILPFEGGGAYPVQYDLDYQNKHYYLRYRWGNFSIDIDDVDVLEPELDAEAGGSGGEWTDEETTVYLYEISRAIRAGRLYEIALPSDVHLLAHPLHIKGPLPVY